MERSGGAQRHDELDRGVVVGGRLSWECRAEVEHKDGRSGMGWMIGRATHAPQQLWLISQV
jgi:hypothetical protein